MKNSNKEMPRSILEFGIFPSNRLRFPLLIAFVISCISYSLFSGYRLLALFCQIFKTRICEVNGNYEVLLLAASFFISITGMILFFGRIIIFQRDVDKKGMILFLSCCCLGCFFVFTCPGVFWYSSAGELLLKAERIQLPVILLGGGIMFGSFLYFIIKELFELIKIILSKLLLWRFSDFLFLAVIYFCMNFLLFWYVHDSKCVYFWDNAGYWTMASEMSESLSLSNLKSFCTDVYQSVFDSDYNQIIAIPFAIIMKIFGGNRWVFLEGILHFGTFPVFVLVFYLAKETSNHPYFNSLLVFISLPVIWQTGVTGFVDVAGCVFAILACILLFSMSRDSGNYPVLTGFFLSLILLLRRWYAFFSVSFFIIWIVLSLFNKKQRFLVLKSALSAAFTLLFFFQNFVSDRLLADYHSLYEAYSFGIGADLRLFFRYYGVLPVILWAALGMVILRHKQLFSGCFLIMQPVLCFFLFTCVQTHGQQHLLLYVPAFLCTFLYGIAELQSILIQNAGKEGYDPDSGKRRRLIQSGYLTTVAILVFSFVSPMFPRTQPGTIAEIKGYSLLPSFSYSAPRRTDTDTLLELATDLDQWGQKGKSVGVLSSSFTFNQDILLNLESSLNVKQRILIDRKEYLKNLPQVDSRDGFSGEVLDCDILVIADPIQTHLGEENQKSIVIPAEMILSHQGIGKAYQKTGRTYQLQNQVMVSIYEKTEIISDEDIQELKEKWETEDKKNTAVSTIP